MRNKVTRTTFIPYTETELKNEVWKPYAHNGITTEVMVSNLGRILVNGIQPAMSITKDGYIRTYSKYQERLHRYVALTFIPNPENKETVNHIDGNKANNRISNLEWSTRKENTIHAVDNDQWSNKRNVTLVNIKTNEKIYFKSLARAAKYLCISPTTLLPKIKYSSDYPLFGTYIISLDKDEIVRPLLDSGRSPIKIWCYDIVTNKQTVYNSISECVYELAIPIATLHKYLDTEKWIFGYYFTKEKPEKIEKPELTLADVKRIMLSRCKQKYIRVCNKQDKINNKICVKD